MQASREYGALVDLIAWIDENTAGSSSLPDDRSKIAAGCFDVALEHQAAIAVLHSSGLPGSMLALLRILAESLVRGLWLLQCATETELQEFKRGKLDKKFYKLVEEFEAHIGTPSGVLSGFKASAWVALNGFTHTGFNQVTRRHAPGKLGANYPEKELAQALGAAGSLGLIAAAQLAVMADRQDLIPAFMERMSSYTQTVKAQ